VADPGDPDVIGGALPRAGPVHVIRDAGRDMHRPERLLAESPEIGTFRDRPCGAWLRWPMYRELVSDEVNADRLRE
jgi:hypothetical protein